MSGKIINIDYYFIKVCLEGLLMTIPLIMAETASDSMSMIRHILRGTDKADL